MTSTDRERHKAVDQEARHRLRVVASRRPVPHSSSNRSAPSSIRFEAYRREPATQRHPHAVKHHEAEDLFVGSSSVARSRSSSPSLAVRGVRFAPAVSIVQKIAAGSVTADVAGAEEAATTSRSSTCAAPAASLFGLAAGPARRAPRRSSSASASTSAPRHVPRQRHPRWPLIGPTFSCPTPVARRTTRGVRRRRRAREGVRGQRGRVIDDTVAETHKDTTGPR